MTRKIGIVILAGVAAYWLFIRKGAPAGSRSLDAFTVDHIGADVSIKEADNVLQETSYFPFGRPGIRDGEVNTYIPPARFTEYSRQSKKDVYKWSALNQAWLYQTTYSGPGVPNV